MLTGFIWNRCGIRDIIKRYFILDTTITSSVGFIGIQETIMQEYPEAILNSLRGNLDFNWTSIPSRGRSGGILVGVNETTFQVLEKETRIYCVRVKT
jgi:hypothetical protein